MNVTALKFPPPNKYIHYFWTRPDRIVTEAEKREAAMERGGDSPQGVSLCGLWWVSSSERYFSKEGKSEETISNPGFVRSHTTQVSQAQFLTWK